MGFISVLFSGKINLNCKTQIAPLDSTLSPKLLSTHNFFVSAKPGDVDAKSSGIIYKVKNRVVWIFPLGLERLAFDTGEKTSSVLISSP